MWKDPIVKETRKRREEYAASLRHDPDTIFSDIRKRQAESMSRFVSFPARKPAARRPCA